MSDTPDARLLEQFARNQSEPAFAEVVMRYIGLVYSVALRKTGNPQHAEDVTQAVFIILARKAGSLGPKTVLAGWLYHTARLTAANVHRAELSRIRREQEAFMQPTENEPAPDALWCELSPLLEDAMARMRASDRDAIVLRFFQNLSLPQVGTSLGISERAAQKRVNRALEKLRHFFARRGVRSTTAIIAGTISGNAVHAAPASSAQFVTTAAIAKGAMAGSSTLTLVKGTLKLLAWTKIKTAAVVGAVVLLAAGTTTVTIAQLHRPSFNDGFWESSYSPGFRQTLANAIGPIHFKFPPQPVAYYNISPALNTCMQVSGFCYLLEKHVSAGGMVKFGGYTKPLNGDEWVAAFENALQTNMPEWLDPKTKKFRSENLVLIRYPEQRLVLVLPPEEAARYQNLDTNTLNALAKEFEPAAPRISVVSPEEAFLQESTNRLNLAKQLGLACRIFAQEHNDRLPENLAELKAYGGNLPNRNWEMVSGGRLDNIRNPSMTIMLREIEPRQGPNGTFVKAYTFADGRARLETSPDGDFTALERQRGFLVHPAGKRKDLKKRSFLKDSSVRRD